MFTETDGPGAPEPNGLRRQVLRQILLREQEGLALEGTAVQQEAPELHQTACDCFGAWETALQYAGAPVRSWQIWSREAVLDRVCGRRMDACSLEEELVRAKYPELHAAALSHFGSWFATLEAVGIDPLSVEGSRALGRDDLLAAIVERNQQRKSLIRRDVSREDFRLVCAAKRLFRGWTHALRAARLEPGEVNLSSPPDAPAR